MYSIFRCATVTITTLVFCAVGCQERVSSVPKPVLRKPLESARVISSGSPAPDAKQAFDIQPEVPAELQPILQVEVSGAKSSKGVYACALFDDEEKLKQRKDPVCADRFPASDEDVRWSIDALPPGEYAIAVYHDANENDTLDRHALGYPIEAYGFSNNARGKFGPPPYDKIRFRITEEPLKLQIRIQ